MTPSRQAKRKPSGVNKRVVFAVAGALVLIVVIVAALLLLTRDTEARQIKALIKRGVQAVTDEDVAACLSLLHESYTDSLGNDFDTVRDRAAEGFGELSDIVIKTRHVEVEVDGGVGTATFEMRFTARVDDGMGAQVPIAGVTGTQSPLGMNWERVSMRCVNRDGDWRVTQIVIEPADGKLL